MSKEITCALVIINKDGDILGCRGTGKKFENSYDFPKGCHDKDDKDHLATACRELKEETGITMSIKDIDSVIDCGIYPHNANKDIHIFLWQVSEFPDVKTLKCNSFFKTKTGKQYPEICGYKIIKKKERSKYFYRVLQDKFEIIDKYNK